MRVAVIGLGNAGRAQVRLFGPYVHAAYDPVAQAEYPAGRVAACDFAVIAAGTPSGPGGTADTSGVLAALAELPAGLPALIRSTVPPGTMARLTGNGRLIGHWPEFITEHGPWRQPEQVPFQILGGTRYVHDRFGPAIEQVTGTAPHLCTAAEAELAKYTANTWLATKVTFANEMARVCAAFGASWDEVRAAWVLDPRAGESHTRVLDGGGFGGRCLPKDLAALIAAAEHAGYEARFLGAVQAANRVFRAQLPPEGPPPMTFAFRAVGTRHEVIDQIREQAGRNWPKAGDMSAELVAEVMAAEDDTPAGPGRQMRYVVSADGHAGGGQAARLLLSIEALAVPAPQ